MSQAALTVLTASIDKYIIKRPQSITVTQPQQEEEMGTAAGSSNLHSWTWKCWSVKRTPSTLILVTIMLTLPYQIKLHRVAYIDTTW